MVVSGSRRAGYLRFENSMIVALGSGSSGSCPAAGDTKPGADRAGRRSARSGAAVEIVGFARWLATIALAGAGGPRSDNFVVLS